MGWFTRPSLKHKSKKEELWILCTSCKAHIFKEEWKKNLGVCPKCNFHEKITWEERIALTLDPGSFQELGREVTYTDPLQFVDGKGPYAAKAEEARTATKMNEAVVTGHGTIEGMPVTVAIMDFRFLGGSLGSGTGEKILLASEYALEKRTPYIVFSASGGARMHEGIISLMQMAKTCAGIARLNKGKVPYISIITNPTFGGVSASYAMVGDLNIAEPGSLVGFAGRRVIEQTIKQKLPDDFQTAEYLLKHGFIDCIVSRTEMRSFLHKILQYWATR